MSDSEYEPVPCHCGEVKFPTPTYIGHWDTVVMEPRYLRITHHLNMPCIERHTDIGDVQRRRNVMLDTQPLVR